MGEYTDIVERQRQRLAAEEWAKGIREIHVHQLKSLWYDNDETKCDMDNGSVTILSTMTGLSKGGRTVC